jgi:hypothetical protein
MKPKHETINEIIKEKGYTSYLEVGVAKLDNFKHIKCDVKLGIDPIATESPNIKKLDSDAFFDANTDKFDCIFIDGLHHAEQLEKDVINAYNSLNKGGCIIMHDINPFTKEMAMVPRIQEQWTGDCFKCWAGIVTTTKLKTEYKAEKYGLGVIYKTLAKPKEGMTLSDLTYEEFAENRSTYIIE